MKQFFLDIINDYKKVTLRMSAAISIVVASLIYEVLNNQRGFVNDISTVIDSIIPFVKIFILPYIFWYVFIFLSLLYYAVYDGEKYFKILGSIVLGMCICFIIYYLYPTTVVRPAITGDDILTRLIKAIYRKDNPYNCFPSIHVLECVIISIYVDRDKSISKYLRVLINSVSLLIILSTFFIKQHYVYDAVAAAILAYLLYIAFNYKMLIEERAKLGTKVMKLDERQ